MAKLTHRTAKTENPGGGGRGVWRRRLKGYVTPSCGCVFCDLGLKPTKSSMGQLVHADKDNNRWVPCTLHSAP
jgi:hypothetical protein